MQPEPIYAYAKLNARIQPLDREDYFEEPLEEILLKDGFATVSGGGTMQEKSGEVFYCGIDIDIFDLDRAIPIICETLTKLGAPQGSELEYTVDDEKKVIPFGELEGLALYLNGTDLPDSVYEESDINYLYEEINRLIEGTGEIKSHWQGPTETALYLYGKSAEKMKSLIKGLLLEYPLCQKSRLEIITA